MATLLQCFIFLSCLYALYGQKTNSVTEESKEHWNFNYKDIQAWAKHYKTCNGPHQSPINFHTKPGSMLELNNYYPKLDIVGYDQKISDIDLTNNGHTVVATVAEGMSIAGGPLGNSCYKFVQLHFHWGSYDAVGSEHRLDNEIFPIECHFVHYNVKYKSLDLALDQPDGLLVIGVWGELSDKNNTALQPIVTALSNVTFSPSKTSIVSEDIEPMEDLFPINRETYYHYNGSLTTPTCHESVVWIVFNETIKISEYQLNEFRTLKQGDENHLALEDNYRPLQPLNGRVVELVQNKAVNFNPAFVIVVFSTIITFVFKY